MAPLVADVGVGASDETDEEPGLGLGQPTSEQVTDSMVLPEHGTPPCWAVTFSERIPGHERKRQQESDGT